MLKVILAAAVIVAANVEAALPPLYQTSSEIRNIMSDEELDQKLKSGEEIEKIEKNAQGYEITTNKNKLQVKVIYEPLEHPGPAKYKIIFENPTPLSSQ